MPARRGYAIILAILTGLASASRSQEPSEAGAEPTEVQQLREKVGQLLSSRSEDIHAWVKVAVRAAKLRPLNEQLLDITQAGVVELTLRAASQPDAAENRESAFDRTQRLFREADAPPEITELCTVYRANQFAEAERISKVERLLDQCELIGSSQLVANKHRAEYFNLRALLAEDLASYDRAVAYHGQQLALIDESISKALAAGQQVPFEFRVQQAICRNNTAKTLLRMGDYKAAKDNLEFARKVYERIEPVMQRVINDPQASVREKELMSQLAVHQAWQRLNLAHVLMGHPSRIERDVDDAVSRFSQLRTELEQRLNTTSETTMTNIKRKLTRCLLYCCNDLGSALFTQGKFELAREAFEAALLQLSGQNTSGNLLHLAEVNINLGWVAFVLDEHQTAERHFRAAVKILESKYAGHHRHAEAMSYLARALVAKPDPKRLDEADFYLAKALDERQQYLSTQLDASLSERDRLAFVQSLRVHAESAGWPGVLDAYLELAPNLTDESEREQYERLLAWKGVLGRNRGRVGPKLQEARAQLRALAKARGQNLDAIAEFAALERGIRELERKRTATEVVAPTSLSVLEQTLKESNSAFLDIIEVRNYVQREEGKELTENRSYVGFLLTPNGICRRIDFPAETRDIIESFHEETLKGGVDQTFEDFLDDDGYLDLKDSLVDSLEIIQNQVKRAEVEALTVSPDGVFHLLPFGLLPGVESELWLEELRFHLVASARSLVRRAKRTAAKISSGLIVGNPEFGGNDEPWKPLAATQVEIEAIAGLIRQRSRDPDMTSVLAGPAANKANVRKMIERANLVHFATHGKFLDRFLEDSFAVVDARHELDSAIVLADANVAQGGDSLLTAEEIRNELQLNNVELMVLSACETGRGHVRAGQGVVGLIGSLDDAGAAMVISSLWKVPDEETSDLMQAFFEELVKGNGKEPVSAALQKAQRKLLTESRLHPYYWAAWTVMGAPSHRIEF